MGDCANLSATFLPTQQTTSYGVGAIPYNPPVPFNTGTPILIGIDDIWSGAIDLPFTFCFYGNSYNNIVVGSNGLISFDMTYATSYCPWSFTASVPNPVLPLNAVFGVYHDIDPSVCGGIRYTVIGNAPCRRFIVNFDQVCHFYCNNFKSTTQIVLHETTNIVEVYVQNKPTCNGWNSGNAVIGIQNVTGTVGITPAGRNTDPWTANNEAWRFTPNGPPSYVINWFNSNNVLVGTGANIVVCPTTTTTYSSIITYFGCGIPITLTDQVTINVNEVTVQFDADYTICEGQSVTILPPLVSGGTPQYNYSWNTVPPQFTPSITVSPTVTTTYTVTVTDAYGCIGTASVTVYVNPAPPAPVITGPNPSCSGLTWCINNFNPNYTYAWSAPNALSVTPTPNGQCADIV